MSHAMPPSLPHRWLVQADDKWHRWVQPLISEAHSTTKEDLSIEAFRLQMAELILYAESSSALNDTPNAYPTMQTVMELVMECADANYARLAGWWWQQLFD